MKIIYLNLILLLFLSCNTKDTYKITANIKDLPSGKVKLLKLDLNTNKTILVDSTRMINGKFNFTGKIKNPYVHTITINDTVLRIHLFLEKGKISINGKKTNYKINGSKETTLFRSYKTDSLFEKQTGLKIMTKYANTTFAAFVAYYQFQLFNYNEKTRTDIMNGFDTNVKQSIYYKHLAKLNTTLNRVAISKKAPNFKIKNTKGKTIELNQFKGDYVLLDFWASWCAPCRAENPELVSVYQKLKTENFEIISISVDTKKDKWLKAIADDGLTWTNVSNLKGWDYITDLYGVKAVPQNFLLDKNGIIIAKNCKPHEIASIINQNSK